MPNIRTLHNYAIKDVSIHSYFSNTKGIREEESLEKTAISNQSLLSVRVQTTLRKSALRP